RRSRRRTASWRPMRRRARWWSSLINQRGRSTGLDRRLGQPPPKLRSSPIVSASPTSISKPLVRWPARPCRSIRIPAPSWPEGVGEHVIGTVAALFDAFVLVEDPVNPQVNAALAVLFLGLGQRLEAAGQEWPDGSVIAPGNTVELIRHEGEGDLVGPVEV